jgi:hypothetical protein
MAVTERVTVVDRMCDREITQIPAVLVVHESEVPSFHLAVTTALESGEWVGPCTMTRTRADHEFPG